MGTIITHQTQNRPRQVVAAKTDVKGVTHTKPAATGKDLREQYALAPCQGGHQVIAALQPEKTAMNPKSLEIHGFELKGMTLVEQGETPVGHHVDIFPLAEIVHQEGRQRLPDPVGLRHPGGDEQIPADGLFDPELHRVAKAAHHYHQGRKQGHRRDQCTHGNGDPRQTVAQIAGGQVGRPTRTVARQRMEMTPGLPQHPGRQQGKPREQQQAGQVARQRHPSHGGQLRQRPYQKEAGQACECQPPNRRPRCFRSPDRHHHLAGRHPSGRLRRLQGGQHGDNHRHG